jgi:hypothetical protein
MRGDRRRWLWRGLFRGPTAPRSPYSKSRKSTYCHLLQRLGTEPASPLATISRAEMIKARRGQDECNNPLEIIGGGELIRISSLWLRRRLRFWFHIWRLRAGNEILAHSSSVVCLNSSNALRTYGFYIYLQNFL